MSPQHRIETDDAALLMYLGDELPVEERARIDRQLAEDPALRGALSRMQEMSGGVAALFRQGDEQGVSALEESRRAAAVRRVSRAMVKQQIAAPAARPAERGEDVPRRFLPRWTYHFAAAAIIIVGLVLIVQWGGTTIVQDPTSNGPGEDFNTERRAARQAFMNEMFAIDASDRDTITLISSPYDVSTMFQPEAR